MISGIELDILNIEVFLERIAEIDEKSIVEQIAACLNTADSEVLNANQVY
jgi:hypothetical protein